MEKFLKLFDDSTGVSIDTRKIKEGSLFVALKGDNFNGNHYAKQAIEKGAKYAIVDEEHLADEKQIFFVQNALTFLQKLARAHRDRFQIPILGITGSNGKTTSKELINCVLQKKHQVLCTEGNLNNHIGVPLTLLRLKQHHTLAIIEMGANRIGEIAELCEIANPNYGLITNIGKAHLEGFKNFEGVFKTKTALYAWVINNNGILFYNNDDSTLQEYLVGYTHKVSFGIENSQIEGKIIAMNPYLSFEWKFNENSVKKTIQSQLTGKYNFYNFLSAIAIGSFFKVSPELINAALEEYLPDNKRSEIRKTNQNTLIIDCYNANPSSMKLALDSFGHMDGANRIAILGDMKELGSQSNEEHKAILEQCVSLGIPFFTIGKEFKSCNIKGFGETKDFIEFLQKNPLEKSTILLKGSRGMALENLIEFL